ncbi:MAG: flagellar hook basal-body protein [Planctomycetaceae bacterium]|nr:flagellar hook basal-body protein [Planctomycetaceae bacterium]
MESARGTFIAGMVLGAALGLVSGHMTLWHEQSSTNPGPEPFLIVGQHDATQPIRVAEVPPQLFPTDLATDFTIPQVGDNTAKMTGLAVSPTQSQPPERALQGRSSLTQVDEPNRLPTETATPLTASGKTPEQPEVIPSKQPAVDPALKTQIDRELADFPQAERDVWYDSLRGMSPDHVTGVLQMWKRFGIPRTSEAGLPATPDAEITPSLTMPQPDMRDLLDPSSPQALPQPVLSAGLALARAHHLRNLAHANTPGYKRLVPMPVEQSTDGTPDFSQCQSRIDWTPGKRQATGMPLDWAIEGTGMFVVRRGDREFHTRNGHWSLDGDRFLCLNLGEVTYRLVPELQVPEDARELSVDDAGLVTIRSEEDARLELGHVRLVTFFNAAALESIGGGLFAATDQSGAALKADPGANFIRQGELEGSNVVLEEEWHAVETYEALLER